MFSCNSQSFAALFVLWSMWQHPCIKYGAGKATHLPAQEVSAQNERQGTHLGVTTLNRRTEKMIRLKATSAMKQSCSFSSSSFL